MEQLVILLIIGIISLVNWLVQRSGELRKKQKLERERLGIPEGNPYRAEHEKTEPAPERRRDPAADMRKLMEALGVPIEEEIVPEPARMEPPPLPKKEPPKIASAPKPSRPALAMTRPAYDRPARAKAPVSPTQQNAYAKILRTKDGIREAIVMREILGPPKAFTL